MRAVGLVARHEILAGFRDYRIPIVTVMLTVLFIAGAWFGVQEYVARQAEQDAFAARERDRWLGQGKYSPHTAAHHGIYAFQPQTRLSAIERGVTSWSGSVVFLEAHYQNFFRFRPVEDRGAARRLGELSIAALIEVLLPLVIVTYAYGTVASEREAGTLSLLLAHGLRPAHFIAGKLVAVLATVALGLTPALIITCFFSWPRENFMPHCVLAGLYAGYLMQIAAVVIAVSAFAKSTSRALVFCVMFWLWNCAIAPRVGVSVAAQLNPAPDALDVKAATTGELSQRPTLWDRREDINQRFLRQYGVATIKDLPVNPDGILLMEQEEQDTLASGRGVDLVYAAQRKQERYSRWAALIAPSFALHSLSMAIAGTDLYHVQRFARAAEEYRRKLVLDMNRATAYDRSLRLGTINPRAQALDVEAGRELWEKIPPFRYEPPEFAEVLRENTDTLAIYLAWTIAAPLLLLAVAGRFYRFVL